MWLTPLLEWTNEKAYKTYLTTWLTLQTRQMI